MVGLGVAILDVGVSGVEWEDECLECDILLMRGVGGRCVGGIDRVRAVWKWVEVFEGLFVGCWSELRGSRK